MNKFDSLFKLEFTTKQVMMLYCHLIDDVKNDQKEMKLLDDAYDRALSRTLKKSFEEGAAIMKNGNAVLCS